VCQQEAIDQRFNHLDTTSFSLTGDYLPESDQHAIAITYGYSKDHRPDLKQAVLELMVSQGTTRLGPANDSPSHRAFLWCFGAL
jgi:transposase